MLIVPDDDFTLLGTQWSPFLGIETALRVKVHATNFALPLGILSRHSGKDNVLENGRDHLLSRPHRLGLEDGRRHSLHAN